MEIMFDTVDLDQIRTCAEIYPFTGVTSNPSIVKQAGKVDFFRHLNAVRSIIGKERTLHVQVVAQQCDRIVEEAERIREKIDDRVCIKIPVSEEGLKAIRILKAKDFRVTATCIYTKIQGDLAILAGVDYIAPYFNRMENMSIDPRATIRHFAEFIGRCSADTKILAASFKNIGQVTDAFDSGAHCVTLNPGLLHDALNAAFIQDAVDKFAGDWYSIYGDGKLITDLK